jgi:hypothetical protein
LRNSFARRPLWLVVRDGNSSLEVLTTSIGTNGEALPVFSFEEEAKLFLRYAVLETGWRVRETTAGELVSVLCGPCVDVGKVALDPPPEIAGKAMINLVSVGRKDFVQSLLSGEREPAARRQVPLRQRVIKKPIAV